MKLISALALITAALVSHADRPAGAAALPAVAPTVIPTASLGGARSLGSATATRVDFSVVLPYQHPADLPALLKAQQTPGSRYFHHFLSAAAFRNYFSPTPAVYAAAAQMLKTAGFSVELFANRTAIHAHGTGKTAAAFFHTTIDVVRQPDGRLAYANVAPAAIPAALAGMRIVGLNSTVTAKTALSAATRSVRAAASGGSLLGPDGGFGPLAIAKAEDFPVEHGYTGRNSNVADLMDGAARDTDVAAYLKAFGLQRNGPRTTVRAVDGGCASCSDPITAAIDAEQILGAAPGATLIDYELPSLSSGGIADGFNAIASDDAVNIVNVSIGFCEINGGDTELAIEPLIAQGSAEGITYEAVAFGGANFCGLDTVGLPMAPANLDTVTAIGASSTITDLSGTQLAQSAYASSNGGTSFVIPEPSWQASTAGLNRTGRNVPDIVLPGSVDGVGPSVYYQGKWSGGFSFVNNAPFAGYLATVQEMYGYATPLGNVDSALYAAYRVAGYTGAAYFSDITLGCIGVINGTAVCASPGYDYVGGIGSIHNGFALAKTLGSGPLQPPTP